MLISSKNTLKETSKIIFEHISGYHGPDTLTHKINHHIYYRSIANYEFNKFNKYLMNIKHRSTASLELCLSVRIQQSGSY